MCFLRRAPPASRLVLRQGRKREKVHTEISSSTHDSSQGDENNRNAKRTHTHTHERKTCSGSARRAACIFFVSVDLVWFPVHVLHKRHGRGSSEAAAVVPSPYGRSFAAECGPFLCPVAAGSRQRLHRLEDKLSDRNKVCFFLSSLQTSHTRSHATCAYVLANSRHARGGGVFDIRR